MKRTDYINWDEYFMGIALLTAMRSKDPSSQVGACIVSPEVVYYGDKYHDSDSSVAARFMFKKAGVRLTAYTPSGRKELLEL